MIAPRGSDPPLAKPLKEFEDRRDFGHLRVGEMCQTVPYTVPLRVANVVLANIAADDECIVNNNNIFYSNFCVDLTEKLRRASSSCSIPVACLVSSSSSDLLTLMHNRTGHGNLRMLIESAKSKLVTGLQIEDSHIRKFKQDDKHVCDICARAKIT